jgi:hypothetical protein
MSDPQRNVAIRVLPANWPPGRKDNLPGKLRLTVPQKNMPPFELGRPEKVWALPGLAIGEERTADSDGFGRLAFFPSHLIDRPSFDALLKQMDIQISDQAYAAFGCKAQHKDYEQHFKTYLVQMRFVTRAALRDVYGIHSETELQALPEQSVNLGEALWRFVQHEKKRVEPTLDFVPDRVALALGYIPPVIMPYGIPDVREGLGFGLMTENRPSGIYRIWSRLAMITK